MELEEKEKAEKKKRGPKPSSVRFFPNVGILNVSSAGLITYTGYISVVLIC